MHLSSPNVCVICGGVTQPIIETGGQWFCIPHYVWSGESLTHGLAAMLVRGWMAEHGKGVI